MGCTSSTQTTAQDKTRPSTKRNSSTPETGNENGGPAADSDTIPDQSQAQESSAPDATKETESCDETITSDAAGPVEVPDQPEEPQTNPSTTDESHEQPAQSENTTEDQKDSSPPENIPENTTEDQADSSPPEEAPASTEES